MIRVLHIFHEMANGGVEAYVMNNYRNIDRTKIQFDFLTSVDKPGYFDEEIKELGGRLYRAYPLKKNPFKNYYDIARIVRENKYQIVHRHTGSAFGYFDLRAAKKGGAEHLLIHAHNPQARTPIVHKLVRNFLPFECEKLACSEAAGDFLYGKGAKFTVLTNAIDCKKYSFSKTAREEVRKEWGVEDSFVVGHIGRIEQQKNHKKLLEIFAEVLKIIPNSKLVCVGDGTMRGEIQEYAKQLNLKNHILFLGTRDDINRILNGFDVFCFPSFYEGFSIVQIEAQSNGLQIVASKDVVPAESNITGNVTFVPLESGDDEWAKVVVEVPRQRDLSACDKVICNGYDLSTAASKLMKYYFSIAGVKE